MNIKNHSDKWKQYYNGNVEEQSHVMNFVRCHSHVQQKKKNGDEMKTNIPATTSKSWKMI